VWSSEASCIEVSKMDDILVLLDGARWAMRPSVQVIGGVRHPEPRLLRASDSRREEPRTSKRCSTMLN
ncbi:unnamed protein product, partial [Citrullus colocynthis]